MKILVVDDVPVVRMVIAKALTRAGHTVLEAGDGGEALTVLKSHQVEVLVTDIWMPGVGGLDLIGQIRVKWPTVAIVAMSGGNPQSSMPSSLSEAFDAGATEMLMKPIDKDELLAAVAEAVRRERISQ